MRETAAPMQGQSRAQLAILVAVVAVVIVILMNVNFQPDNVVQATQLPAPTPSVTF